MPNEICKVIVEERSKDGLYRWFLTNKPIVRDTERINLIKGGTYTGKVVNSTEIKILEEAVYEIEGISKASVSRYLLTVNLASEMFDWEEDDIELKVFKIIQDTIGVPVRVIKRKDSHGNAVNTGSDSGMDDLEPIEVSDTLRGDKKGDVQEIREPDIRQVIGISDKYTGVPPDPRDPETVDRGEPKPKKPSPIITETKGGGDPSGPNGPWPISPRRG